jgi:hypothetical protein
VGGGIKRIIPLDLGGWAGSIGRVRGMPEVWPLALGLLRWAMGFGRRINERNARESSGYRGWFRKILTQLGDPAAVWATRPALLTWAKPPARSVG